MVDEPFWYHYAQPIITTGTLPFNELIIVGIIIHVILLFLHLLYAWYIKSEFQTEAKKEDLAILWIGATYSRSILALSLVQVNYIFFVASLYLSHGTIVLFWQAEGILAIFGLILFFYFFPNALLNIIHLSKQQKKIFAYVMRLLLLILLISAPFIFLEILNLGFDLTLVLFVIYVIGTIFFLFLMGLLIYTLVIARKLSRSQITRQRINLITIGVIFFLLDLTYVIFAVLFRTLFQIELSTNIWWLAIIQPIVRFGFYSGFLYFNYLGTFFPAWIRVRLTEFKDIN